MKHSKILDRRDFLKTAAMGTAGYPCSPIQREAAETSARIARKHFESANNSAQSPLAVQRKVVRRRNEAGVQ